MKVELIESTGDPEGAIARAARVSREPNPIEEDFSKMEDQELIRKLRDWGMKVLLSLLRQHSLLKVLVEVVWLSLPDIDWLASWFDR